MPRLRSVSGAARPPAGGVARRRRRSAAPRNDVQEVRAVGRARGAGRQRTTFILDNRSVAEPDLHRQDDGVSPGTRARVDSQGRDRRRAPPLSGSRCAGVGRRRRYPDGARRRDPRDRELRIIHDLRDDPGCGWIRESRLGRGDRLLRRARRGAGTALRVHVHRVVAFRPASRGARSDLCRAAGTTPSLRRLEEADRRGREQG